MARVLTDGSGKGTEAVPSHMVLPVGDNGTVQLPEGLDVSAMEITRDGQDLVLIAPNGESFVIENYFLNADAPVIVSSAGSLLSPALVQSFLKSGNEVAAVEQSSDASPVGEVTEVTGNAHVTHADGSKEAITAGTRIFEGDIIETDAKGAVNIKFADDSTFAVSENARMAVDDFQFNPADQSGTTGISILRGVFMFTSGLIGRENPDAVHLETPVGSIGIRGTIIGGSIAENGQSEISVIEGAIVVRNGTGEQILSSQYETVRLTGFNAPINNIGQMNAQQMSQSYGAVRSVSQTLFTSIDDTARDAQPDSNSQPNSETQTQQPANTQDEGTPQPGTQDNSTQAQPNTTEATAATEAPVEASPVQTSPVLTETTIFQTLNTGSNISNPLGAQSPVTAGPLPPAPPLTVTITPQPGNTTPVQTTPTLPTEEVIDRRTPAAVTFTQGGSVDENTASGGVVGTLASANPFAVTYSLVTNPNNQFAINAQTGLVTLASNAGDFDTGTTGYDLAVRATRTDNPQLFTETTMRVAVNDVDEKPVFTSGSNLAANEGFSVALTSTGMGAIDPEHTTNLTYAVSGVTKGSIQVNNASTWTNATVFTQAQLDAGNVRYLHNGDEPNTGQAGFTLVATDATGHASLPRNVVVNITGVNDAPVQEIRQGSNLTENSFHTLAQSNLLYTDTDNTPSEIVYTVDALVNGTVRLFNGSTWQNTSTFTQHDINNDNVRFYQDGTESTFAQFTYTVRDTAGAVLQQESLSFAVDNEDDVPVKAGGASAVVSEGGNLTLTPAILQYTDVDTSAADLKFTPLSVTHGTLQYSADGTTGWTTLNAGQTFSQADINNGRIRFLHDGNNATSAQFTYTLEDDTTTSTTQTQTLTVTQINDEPTSLSVSTATIAERNGTNPETAIATLTIVDDETVASNPAYSFSVSDNRFQVIDDNGVWKLAAKQNTTFDYESEPSINLVVSMTDGTHPARTQNVTVTISDVDEPASEILLNDGVKYDSTYDSVIQGGVNGAYIGTIRNDDPDTSVTSASSYSIHSFTSDNPGSNLNINSFEVANVTDDAGQVSTILRLKNGVAPLFNDEQITLVVRLQNADSSVVDASFVLGGRSDVMYLESVNGRNGFTIYNDARIGAGFGTSLITADYNNDGLTDILVGAPNSFNSNGTGSERSGGLFAFATTTGTLADAQDNGEITLSNTHGNLARGYGRDIATGSDDNNLHFAASIAALENFTAAGPAIAVAIPDKNGITTGTVKIIGGTDGNTIISTITGIPIFGLTDAGREQGIKVTSIGDVNSDGYTDLLITAATATSGAGAQSGRGVVVYGGASISTSVDMDNAGTQLTGLIFDSKFGYSASSIGDFNNDGYDDLVVSAPQYDGSTSGNSHGLTTVYYGSSAGINTSARLNIVDSVTQDKMGLAVSSAGDFNGDGFADIMTSRSATYSGRGSVEVVFGAINLTGNKNIDTDGMAKTTLFWGGVDSSIKVGDSITSAGDFNGDGYGDIVVDVSKHISGSEYQHTLYVVYGSATPLSSYDLQILDTDTTKAFKIKTLETTGEHLTLSSGDINGDGFTDILVGDRYAADDENNPVQDGRVTVVYGGNRAHNAPTTGVVHEANFDNQIFNATSFDDRLETFSHVNATFNGGAGDDEVIITDTSAIKHYNGGSGYDTLTLGFSSFSEATVGNADSVLLSGLSLKATGIEAIRFDVTSRQDALVLNIQDVLSLAHSSEDQALRIISIDTASHEKNSFYVEKNNALVNLSSLTGSERFTRDADNNSVQDSRNENGVDFWVYTNQATGNELLVDQRLYSSADLATA